MEKFRKKPIVIEAVQWDGTAEGATPIIDWILQGSGVARYHDPGDLPPDSMGALISAGIHIITFKGPMVASCGDYIIRGVKGEFYPCKPDIFEATYDPVES